MSVQDLCSVLSDSLCDDDCPADVFESGVRQIISTFSSPIEQKIGQDIAHTPSDLIWKALNATCRVEKSNVQGNNVKKN